MGFGDYTAMGHGDVGASNMNTWDMNAMPTLSATGVAIMVCTMMPAAHAATCICCSPRHEKGASCCDQDLSVSS